MAAAKGFATRDALLGSGLKFESQKYFVLQADDERIMGKQGSRGFFCYKTKQGKCLVVRRRFATLLL